MSAWLRVKEIVFGEGEGDQHDELLSITSSQATQQLKFESKYGLSDRKGEMAY